MLKLDALFVPLTVPAALLVLIVPALLPARAPTFTRPVTLAPERRRLLMVPAEPTEPKRPTPVSVGRLMNRPLMVAPLPMKLPVKPVIGANPAPEFQPEVPEALNEPMSRHVAARFAALLPTPCRPYTSVSWYGSDVVPLPPCERRNEAPPEIVKFVALNAGSAPAGSCSHAPPGSAKFFTLTAAIAWIVPGPPPVADFTASVPLVPLIALLM